MGRLVSENGKPVHAIGIPCLLYMLIVGQHRWLLEYQISHRGICLANDTAVIRLHLMMTLRLIVDFFPFLTYLLVLKCIVISSKDMKRCSINWPWVLDLLLQPKTKCIFVLDTQCVPFSGRLFPDHLRLFVPQCHESFEKGPVFCIGALI